MKLSIEHIMKVLFHVYLEVNDGNNIDKAKLMASIQRMLLHDMVFDKIEKIESYYSTMKRNWVVFERNGEYYNRIDVSKMDNGVCLIYKYNNIPIWYKVQVKHS